MEVEITPQELMARMHRGDPIAKRLGIEFVSCDHNEVVLKVVVDERHTGGHHLCHGGMLFCFADVAMAYISNRFNKHSVATHASIEFLDAVKTGQTVFVTATQIHGRNRSSQHDVTMTVEGETVAIFRGATLALNGAVTDLY